MPDARLRHRLTGKVWIYRPTTHKTAHHGHERVIAIGPRAQSVLREFLTIDTQAYLFSPKWAVAELLAEKRKRRKSKVQPSQRDRRKRRPKCQPGDCYTASSYGYAVRRACKRAGTPPWHPHQLRHSLATELRREFGIDAARAVLGHRSPAITEVYAEIDAGTAAKVMAKLG